MREIKDILQENVNKYLLFEPANDATLDRFKRFTNEDFAKNGISESIEHISHNLATDVITLMGSSGWKYTITT